MKAKNNKNTLQSTMSNEGQIIDEEILKSKKRNLLNASLLRYFSEKRKGETSPESAYRYPSDAISSADTTQHRDDKAELGGSTSSVGRTGLSITRFGDTKSNPDRSIACDGAICDVATASSTENANRLHSWYGTRPATLTPNAVTPNLDDHEERGAFNEGIPISWRCSALVRGRYGKGELEASVGDKKTRVRFAETHASVEDLEKAAGGRANNMPLLPSARDGLSTPRSARAPPASARRSASVASRQRSDRDRDGDESFIPSGGRGLGVMDSPPLERDLRRQNEELRSRLAGDAAEHRRRLDAYRRAQHGQAALVSRLQAKVLQYKQKCAELENQRHETPRMDSYLRPSISAVPKTSAVIALPPPPGLSHQPGHQPTHLPSHASSTTTADRGADERIHDLETALRRMDEERRKCEKLMDQNRSLRDQLEESHQINEALTNDLQKLTNDWEVLREDIIAKEDEWKDEEQAFNDYYTSEHNRLLTLWREVVSVKRTFSEMRSNTERDLYRAKSDIDTAVRDLVATFSGFSITNMANPQSYKTDPQTPFALSSTTATQPALVSEELRNELRDMTSQRDRACAELHERDTRIQRLLAELQNMDDRCNNVEVIASDANVMRNALEEVARALILDSEGDVQVSMPQGSERMGMADRSPKRRPHTPNATAFAESTISAVQAALHKYQLHIHELQVKLHNTRDQLSTNRKSCEIAEANVALLEGKVHNLQGKLDEANADINQLVQEKESMQKSLETLRSDKNSLERNRVEINAMLESLTSDYEKLQKANAKLEKIVESLDAEKRTQQAEIDRLQREAATRETVLRSEEERNGRFRAELVTIREELNRVHLARDLLDQQKLEADSLISHMEKTRSDLEIDLERTLLERGDLQDTVEKLQSSLQSLQAEKNKLLDENKQLEEEKSSLSGQSSDQMGDLNSLRKELLAAEQLRLDLDSDKASLQQQINFLQGEKEKVELDLGQVTRERNELSCQLTAMSRKKDTLNEEIIRLQQRLEQAMETNSRLNRTLEDYVKDCEEKQVVIDGNEKDIQHLQEQLASLRSEKDGLEAVLFDTSNMLEDAHSKKAKLEKELQETLVVQENLKGQVSRLTRDLEISEKKMRDVKNSLTQQSGKKEAEYQQLLNNLARTSAETIKKVNEEKEQIRQTLEHKLNQTIAAMSNEKETLELSWREREKRLRAARDALALQHDEAMLRAENDKQQALLLAQHDLQAVMERLEELKRAFDIEQNNSERLKRDAHAKMEQDRQAANQLKEQLSGLKTRLDEAKASAEDDCARSENRIKELQLEKEASLREVQDTKTQLQLAEDKHDNLANQHNDTLRKLKEVENESESLRKELTDSRRQLTSCSAEREKYSQTCRDLREHVKRAEQDRRETARALDEAYHKLAGLEEVRTSLESERSRLQAIVKESEAMLDRTSGQVKATEAELKRERTLAEQMQNDGKEMQSRIQNETEERERVAAEGAAARRHAAELEALLGAARNDLARARQKVAQLEEGCRARDQELLVRLEDSRSKERRLEELKHNLEVCLADATQQIQELKARLGGAEGRCRALESQLGGAEASRRDAERRLSSVGWALRRVAGVQPDGSVQPAARTRRLTSPARRYSPHRGRDHSDDRGEVIDVDPDLVKKGIRTLMQEVAQVEREKEDYKAQVCVMRKQLKEVQDQAGRGEGKLGATIQSLRATQDEKAKLQACLAQKDAQLKAQVEAVQSKLTEVNSLRDKIVSLENTLSSSTEERGQYEDKCEKMRVVLQQYESELGEVREALAGAEARAARLDVRRTQLEGDLQRAITNIREKEAHVQKIQERCDGYTRTITSLEDRCTSLKGTIEQLTASLQKTASSESDLRSELSRLQRQLSEAKQNDQVTAEKLRQLQKSVSNCDNEKRILAEKLDAAKISWSEAKRLNAALEDQVHRLTNQLANVEIQRSGLESQLRLSAWDGVGKESSTDTETERELHALQREKLELKAKVDALQDTIRKLETEKRLKPTIEGYRSRSHDRQDKSVYLSSDIDSGDSSGFKDLSRVPVRDTDVGRRREGLSSTDLSLLEIENRELKMRIRRLEKDLADKESELAIARTRFLSETGVCSGAEEEARYRQAAHTAERLLQAREASHRQQMQRMETQLQQLRSQLSCELRRRQNYVARSGRAARDVQRLRTALGDSLRTVAQEPALDSYLLEHEARKLDNTLTHSLPPLSDYETIK